MYELFETGGRMGRTGRIAEKTEERGRATDKQAEEIAEVTLGGCIV